MSYDDMKQFIQDYEVTMTRIMEHKRDWMEKDDYSKGIITGYALALENFKRLAELYNLKYK